MVELYNPFNKKAKPIKVRMTAEETRKLVVTKYKAEARKRGR